MGFIKAEEFLKQSVEIQKVLLDWWKPSPGNLYVDTLENMYLVLEEQTDQERWDRLKASGEIIPLFLEGQLRQFIEDKTKDKYDILYSFGLKKYISFYKYTENENKATYEVDNHDLLKAYWEVAIKVSGKCL